MYLASLNVDVLLYLIKFIDPVDRFNLVLSGILKGFENVSKEIDPKERRECFRINLGLCRGSMHDLEIRSLTFSQPLNDLPLFNCPSLKEPSHSDFKIFKQLAKDGFLRNNRSLVVSVSWPRGPQFVLSICSMSNLEELEIRNSELIFDDLSLLFKSCPQLIKLHLDGFKCNQLDWDQDIKNRLRPGFKRLRFFWLECYINEDSWSVIQEIFSWLDKCAELHLCNTNYKNGRDSTRLLLLDGSLKLNSDLVQHLQYLNLRSIPVELLSWILSSALNIHTLNLAIDELPNRLHNKIFQLEKLKNLVILITKTNNLKQFFRNCRQLETLNMSLFHPNILDFVDFEPVENVRKIQLHLWGSSIKQILQTLKKWRQLHHLTIMDFYEQSRPRFKVLCDFIMDMKHLTHLHLTLNSAGSNYDKLKSLQEKVTKFALTNRPNLKFVIH